MTANAGRKRERREVKKKKTFSIFLPPLSISWLPIAHLSPPPHSAAGRLALSASLSLCLLHYSCIRKYSCLHTHTHVRVHTKLNPDSHWAKPTIYLSSWVHHQQQLQPLACLISGFAGSSCRLNMFSPPPPLCPNHQAFRDPTPTQEVVKLWEGCNIAVPLGLIGDRLFFFFFNFKHLFLAPTDLKRCLMQTGAAVSFDSISTSRNSERGHKSHANKKIQAAPLLIVARRVRDTGSGARSGTCPNKHLNAAPVVPIKIHSLKSAIHLMLREKTFLIVARGCTHYLKSTVSNGYCSVPSCGLLSFC